MYQYILKQQINNMHNFERSMVLYPLLKTQNELGNSNQKKKKKDVCQVKTQISLCSTLDAYKA